MAVWRERAAPLLQAAAEVTVFSCSSRDILHKAHPDLSLDRVAVVPHNVSDLPCSPFEPQHRYLHIGVVGRIAEHKGAERVAQLARLIRRRRGEERLTVIGTIDRRIGGRGISVTGSYQRGALQERLQSSGVNVVFMPSICPETFSLVVHEVMAMQLPLLCFDLGAQGEYVLSYFRGAVVPETIKTEPLFEQLQSLFARVYLAGSETPDAGEPLAVLPVHRPTDRRMTVEDSSSCQGAGRV